MEENAAQAAKPDGTPAGQKPFVAPCRELAWSAPFGWLRLGWRDYTRVPRISLIYGGLVFAASALLSGLAWVAGGWVLLIAMLTGFVFVAPLLAFALYSISRQLCLGHTPSLTYTLQAMRQPFQNALVFGLLLLMVFLIWARAGAMVHIFFPLESGPDWFGLVKFLAIGSAVGAVFAGFSFAAAAFSLPFLANRDVDVVTAVVSSINAVLRNKSALLVWATLIVLITAAGVATALLGLVIVIPWLAYATWHGYQQTLDVSQWDTLPVRDRHS